LTRASRGVSASIRPRLTLFCASTALYSKIGIGLAARSWLQHVELGDPQDLVRRGETLQQLVDAVHAQRPPAALERAALDLAGGGLADDLLLDVRVDRHHLVDRHAATVAGTEALVAAAADHQLAAGEPVGRQPQVLELVEQLLVGNRGLLAVGADRA